ncbi:MAG: decarboxylating NADP(+)-dependent phosphogluconate dehydrogenase [Candidatus Tectomicrobia bacterium]|nr:decarboxylating NADP(+)-dependent phosphogluconate dehydrogenase [Candidatus Tectomicrobia bacterium]
MTQQQSDVALIGLAVMGQNLVLNMNDHDYAVSVYNRTASVTDAFLAGPAKDTRIRGFHDLKDMVASLQKPRRIVILVQAGPAVDAVIEQVLPLVEADDIIVDLGNTHYPDTQRRWAALREKGIRFIGSGVSGGEEGARYGPSIMPGGDPDAWPFIKDIFQSISAKADGEPCCDWVGEGGAGHYVKMVHNGIEYGDMQLICEAYQLLHEGLGLSYDDLHEVFSQWNEGELDSYLIEITRDIMAYREEDGSVLVDKILDTAGQKGTGKWTGISALDLGMPVTLIGEAVFARCVSALKDERIAASNILSGPDSTISGVDQQAFIDDVRQALYASKIISYAQGYMLLREAAKEYGWNLNYGGIALMWRGGCIIRSVFLGKIKEAFEKNPELDNLLLDGFFKEAIENCQASWRRVVAKGVEVGIPMPAFTTALAFFDSYRRERLPANLLQAQRDYFGAHTYERVDAARGEFFHTNWTGRGGDVSSRTYNV